MKKVANKSSRGKGPNKPSGTAPRPPKGFEAPEGRIATNVVTAQQESDSTDMAREISTSKTYVEDFTKRAPGAADLAAQLVAAKAWTDEFHAATAWLNYVRVQRELAWDATIATAKELKPEFDLAIKHDTAIGETYPKTMAFLGVWKAAAARAVETKAAKKKAAKGGK